MERKSTRAAYESGRRERRHEHRSAVLVERVPVGRGGLARAQQVLPERAASARGRGRVNRGALPRRLVRELGVFRTVRLLREHPQQTHVELEARCELRQQLMHLLAYRCTSKLILLNQYTQIHLSCSERSIRNDQRIMQQSN